MKPKRNEPALKVIKKPDDNQKEPALKVIKKPDDNLDHSPRLNVSLMIFNLTYLTLDTWCSCIPSLSTFSGKNVGSKITRLGGSSLQDGERNQAIHWKN